MKLDKLTNHKPKKPAPKERPYIEGDIWLKDEENTINKTLIPRSYDRECLFLLHFGMSYPSTPHPKTKDVVDVHAKVDPYINRVTGFKY